MKYTLKNEANLLDAILEMYKGISKQKAKQIISHSDIYIDNNPAKTSHNLIIPSGSVIEVVKGNTVKKITGAPNHKNPVILHYQDDHLIIAQKPAGILSCSSVNEKGAKTFHKLVEDFINHDKTKKFRIWVVHRLDREVEGLIIFAKSYTMQQKMKDIWPSVNKNYLAVTHNSPPQQHGFIESFLRDTDEHLVESFDTQIYGSKYAKTEYKVLNTNNNRSVLEITLHTGRKNQIRVQLAKINCPIIGDRKYGFDDNIVRQIRLAAYKLEFTHPITNKIVKLKYKPSDKFFNPSETNDEKYKII